MHFLYAEKITKLERKSESNPESRIYFTLCRQSHRSQEQSELREYSILYRQGLFGVTYSLEMNKCVSAVTFHAHKI